MKGFSELKVGDEFSSDCVITESDLDTYLAFSGIRNVIYEKHEYPDSSPRMVSGRAVLARMEGEFTKLDEMYGNQIIFYGIDGDPIWNGRQTRFLLPVRTDERLKIRFTISDKRDINDEFGLIAVDFEGIGVDGRTVLLSKRNLYRIKKSA